LMLGLFLSGGNALATEEPVPKIDPAEYRACGVNSLYVVCHIFGVETDLQTVERLVGPKSDGTSSFAELDAAARGLGLQPVAAKLAPEQISLVPAPAILHVRRLQGQPHGNHFLVFLGRTEEGDAVLLDPPDGPVAVSGSRFERLWTGNVLIPCKTKADASALRASLSGSAWVWWAEPSLWSACVITGLLLWALCRRRLHRDAAQEVTVG
jgi:ABC-type bacteriocin/lantibiotic exporter with double-glycine peptidase domain